MSKIFERRMAVSGLEVREGSDSLTLTGYASTFGQPYDMGWYMETVAAGAFDRTLGTKPDVRLLINHGDLPLARTASGTLTLDTDSRGLMVSAELDPSDPDVARLAPKMKRGDVNQMSFAFRTNEDIWENDMTKRTMLALDLADGDVSVVTYPANPNAKAAIRSDGVPTTDAIASALRTLETRNAPKDEVADVLRRALAFFDGVDTIADLKDAAEARAAAAVCGSCDADCCDCTDPECDGTCCDACDAPARTAVAAQERRQRALRLLG